MNNLRKHEPWNVLNHLKDEIESFFDYKKEGANLPLFNNNDFLPDVDIEETNNSYIVKADLPGMSPDDIAINFIDNTLTIEGETSTEHEEKKKNYICTERSSGSFCRSFKLDYVDDNSEIDATYNNGVLIITLAKSKASQTPKRKIEIKSS